DRLRRRAARPSSRRPLSGLAPRRSALFRLRHTGDRERARPAPPGPLARGRITTSRMAPRRYEERLRFPSAPGGGRMRVALVNPAWSFGGSIYFGCREPHLPLELGYTRALLERAGHATVIRDGQL